MGFTDREWSKRSGRKFLNFLQINSAELAGISVLKPSVSRMGHVSEYLSDTVRVSRPSTGKNPLYKAVVSGYSLIIQRTRVVGTYQSAAMRRILRVLLTHAWLNAFMSSVLLSQKKVVVKYFDKESERDLRQNSVVSGRLCH